MRTTQPPLNPLNLAIELMLKSEGFNVYTTDLSEEGVDLAKLYDDDIILLDINLPDMSGYEVLKALRVSKLGCVHRIIPYTDEQKHHATWVGFLRRVYKLASNASTLTIA